MLTKIKEKRNKNITLLYMIKKREERRNSIELRQGDDVYLEGEG